MASLLGGTIRMMNNNIQNRWEKRATVRSRPRITFDNKINGHFFPLSHQPLSIHPKVVELGKDALNYLLIQSLYKYSHDIVMIETKMVNQAILTVIADTLPISFDSETKLALYTVMIDEAYHAYVAFDAMLQIQEYTKIQPLAFPRMIEIECAIKWVHEKLPIRYHDIFNLIAICLAENTLTKDIISMVDKEDTHPFFQKMIKDHLSDESRHSGIFSKLLAYIWQILDLEYKQAIAKILPNFLERYLRLGVRMEFDLKILIAIGLSANTAKEVLDDTYKNFKPSKQHPMLKQILFLLESSGMVDSIVSPYLKEKNWI